MIHHERRGLVSLVTLDRQERRNALDHAALDELAGVLSSLDDARVLVVTGAGGHFCSGADLSGLEDSAFATALRGVLDGLCDLPIPTIAAIDGAALGAGTQLAIACDLRVATPGASLGIPAARLGLMVDHWTVRRLALLAGQGPARAMLLAAEVLKGDEAVSIGLVQRLGSLEDALGWADEIAALAPLTIAGHKAGLNAHEADVSADAAYRSAFARAWASADLEEGVAAFREKRLPHFHGR